MSLSNPNTSFADANNKGYYTTSSALISAIPVGVAGWHAIVGETDTFWIWDTTTSTWVDSGSSGGSGDMAKAVYDPTNKSVSAFDAANHTNTPSGNISSTTVQGAINELSSSIDGLSTGTTWSTITTNQSALSGNYGYLTNGLNKVVVTLPTTSSVGGSLQISAHNSNGWRIAQNAGQVVYIGDMLTTTGIGGYLESTGIGDTIELVCVVANTEWRAVDMQGTITII